MQVVTTYSIGLNGSQQGSNANTTTGNGNTNFSISLWVRYTGTTARVLLCKYDNTLPRGWELFVNSANAQLNLYGSLNTIIAGSGGTTNDGAWHNIVMTYAAGTPDTIIFYIDGVTGPTVTGSHVGSYDTTFPILMGGNSGVNAYYDGEMDDVRFYQTTLSSTDAINLASGNEISTTFRQAYWPIEAGSGSVIADTSGNGNTITFGTAPTWSSSNIPVPPLTNNPPLTLTFFDSISLSDSSVSALSISFSDSVSTSDSFPNAFSVESSAVTLTSVPVVETLVEQLLPANTKVYFRIQE